MNKALQPSKEKALTDQELQLDAAINEMSKVAEDCYQLILSDSKSIVDTFKIAQGAKKIYELLLTPEVKSLVEFLQDKPFGFQTDRSPAAIAWAVSKGKTPPKPYGYEEVAMCVTHGMMNGYRLTNKEMGIIANNFYAARNGKFRKVVEEDQKVTDFRYTTTSPQYYTANGNSYAKVKCIATWKYEGTDQSIGIGENDLCIIPIKVNAGMGDDAINGKAESKLFGRVLTRITGRITPEGDVENYIEGETISSETVADIEDESEKASDSSDLDSALEELEQDDKAKDEEQVVQKHEGDEDAIDPVNSVKLKIEKLRTKDQKLADLYAQNMERIPEGEEYYSELSQLDTQLDKQLKKHKLV